MKLTDMTVTQFHDTLASNVPAPGGGSVAGLEGALGAALIGMVAELTVGKHKYQEHQELMREIVTTSAQLRQHFLLAVDSDSEAFNTVSAVFAMPKITVEEQACRNLAMQQALQECTRSPYDIMRYGLSTLHLAEQALGKSNANALSDLGVAALSLKAAIQGAWLNVLINTSSIKDQDFVSQYRGDGETVLAEASLLADEIYQKVLAML